LNPQRQFPTAFKSVFIFVRAYQDAVCGFLFELRGQRAGRYTSMANALKEGKPTRTFLDEKLPDYREWFSLWKTRRDKIKGGGSFGLAFDAEDTLSLIFLYPESDGMTTEEQHIGLPDVIKGLEMSADLAVVALGQAGDLLFIDYPHKRPLPELSGRNSG
jgi:hypothetical protein